MPKRIVVRGAEIVTMDAALGDFSQADILIEDGKIHAVGPSLPAQGAEAIDGAGMIALPGIIDAHTCLWQTVLRGYVPDLWPGTYYSALLPLRSRYTPEDNFNAAYVGGFEMLSYGTTTVVDYCHDIRSPAYAPASIAALKESGIRHLFTYSFMPVLPDEFAGPGTAWPTAGWSMTSSTIRRVSPRSASASIRSARWGTRTGSKSSSPCRATGRRRAAFT